jgi:hypothetical protein
VQTEAEPEKVHTLDPKINRQHTTFYGQKESLIQLNAAPEKVHNLEPEVYQDESNGPNAFPNQRTAFYAQKESESTTFYDKRNGVWRLEFAEAPEQQPPAVAGQGEGAPIGTTVHAHAVEGGDAIPNARDLQVDPIGPTHYDPWVYEFSWESMGPYAQHAQKKHRKQDIGENGIEENVHWFANEQTDALPNRRKEDTAWDYNGTGPKAHKFTLAQRGK